MGGAIPPLSQYAFIAWCSVKKEAQGQLYLYHLSFNMQGQGNTRDIRGTYFFAF
jgi:hypothetical protein